MRISFILLIAAMALQSCNNDDLCLKGSGNVNTYSIDAEDFHSVSLEGPVNLRIKQGSEYEVSVDAEPEMFAHLEYNVTGNYLEIGFKKNVRCFETFYGVWVNVTVPDLRNIYVSGDSEIVSESSLDLQKLKVDVSGVADLDLHGEVVEFFLDSDGVARGDNLDLHANNVDLDISGSTNIGLSCSEAMHIKVNGSAVVRYAGNPLITQDVSGALELIKVD